MAKQAILLQSLPMKRGGFKFTISCTGVPLSRREAIMNELTNEAQLHEFGGSHYESQWWIVNPGNKIVVLQSGIGTVEPEFTIVVPEVGLEEPNTCLDNETATGLAHIEYLYNIKKQL